MNFREVLEVRMFHPMAENELIKNGPSNYKYPFLMVTKDRKFELFAYSNDERMMWIGGFNYVILSTKEV
jgi:hypothetical protein